MTKELSEIRVKNSEAYKLDLENGKLTRGKWVSYVDGKLVRSEDTRAAAVKGLALGYYCNQVGRDVTKLLILLAPGSEIVG